MLHLAAGKEAGKQHPARLVRQIVQFQGGAEESTLGKLGRLGFSINKTCGWLGSREVFTRAEPRSGRVKLGRRPCDGTGIPGEQLASLWIRELRYQRVSLSVRGGGRRFRSLGINNGRNG